jgi:hypothetical protein
MTKTPLFALLFNMLQSGPRRITLSVAFIVDKTFLIIESVYP